MMIQNKNDLSAIIFKNASIPGTTKLKSLLQLRTNLEVPSGKELKSVFQRVFKDSSIQKFLKNSRKKN